MAVKDVILKNAGVRLAKDGKSIFNYNPGKYSAGMNWAFALTQMPALVTKQLAYQMLALLGCLHLWVWVVPAEDTFAQAMIPMCYANVAGLSRFVLGLFVSLVLGKTYYANRGMFGVLFGRNMGLAQMVAAWIEAPDDDPDALAQAHEARKLILRWANASFRLMWLETGIYSTAEEMGKDMIESTLLTEAEWEHIAGLSSRCTHIYQWMNNMLHKLLDAGYIRDSILLNRMHGQIDDMRGANVWGLPSVPIPYVTLVTLMVKIHLVTAAFAFGAIVRAAIDEDASYIAILIPHMDLILQNFLFQGLLDLHGLLYNPNQGLLLGHLPVVNFLAFVQNVTNALINDSCIQGAKLPYTLDLPPINLDAAGGRENMAIKGAGEAEPVKLGKISSGSSATAPTFGSVMRSLLAMRDNERSPPPRSLSHTGHTPMLLHEPSWGPLPHQCGQALPPRSSKRA